MSIAKIASIQGIDSANLTWGVAIETAVICSEPLEATAVAESFSDSWIPRFSAMMHFIMPFDDAPLINVTDGLPDTSVVLG